MTNGRSDSRGVALNTLALMKVEDITVAFLAEEGRRTTATKKVTPEELDAADVGHYRSLRRKKLVRTGREMGEGRRSADRIDQLGFRASSQTTRKVITPALPRIFFSWFR